MGHECKRGKRLGLGEMTCCMSKRRRKRRKMRWMDDDPRSRLVEEIHRARRVPSRFVFQLLFAFPPSSLLRLSSPYTSAEPNTKMPM
jgi:hypothetical protein